MVAEIDMAVIKLKGTSQQILRGIRCGEVSDSSKNEHVQKRRYARSNREVAIALARDAYWQLRVVWLA